MRRTGLRTAYKLSRAYLRKSLGAQEANAAQGAQFHGALVAQRAQREQERADGGVGQAGQGVGLVDEEAHGGQVRWEEGLEGELGGRGDWHWEHVVAAAVQLCVQVHPQI